METEIKQNIFSKVPDDYEILIRKHGSSFSAFCPQINYLVKGENQDKIKQELKIKIFNFIEKLPKTKEELELENEILNESIQQKNKIQEDYKLQLQGKKPAGMTKEEVFDRLQSSTNSEKTEKIPTRSKSPVFEQKFEDLDNYFLNPNVTI